MPDDGMVCLDNGMYKIWFARNYRTHVANTLLLDNALATMGAGLPSAMMAAMLYPEPACDGGLRRWRLHDELAGNGNRDPARRQPRRADPGGHAYGMIRWKQAADGFADFGMSFGNPDFVRYAEAYGAKGSA